MKTFNSTILKSSLLISAVIGVFTIISCEQNSNTTDTKEIAEDRNEAKFSGKMEDNAEFLLSAAEISIEEIELGKLAQKKSSTPAVVALGKMMVTEHTKALKELQTLATEKQITIPATITDKSKQAYTKLNNKSGIDFDTEYCDMMVKGHEDAIRIFEKASKNAKDLDIQSWAETMLISLRIHLDKSMTCQEKCTQMKSNL